MADEEKVAGEREVLEARLLAHVERQLGSLALSEIEGAGPLALIRSVAWHNVLGRLGLAVPLVVVHDLGCLIAGVGRPASVRQGAGDPRLGEAWRELLVEVAESDLARTPAAWKHRDPMIGVVLARVLGSVLTQLPEHVRVVRPVDMPVDVIQYARIEARSAYARYGQENALAWLHTLCSHRLLPILQVEQIDMDALRLFGLFRSSNDLGGVDLADLYNVIVSPALADVVDFSLELLPSLLEVKREAGQQTFGIDGYASIERTGNIDDLVLTQLALPEDLFEQRFVDRELFYYTHEKQYESELRTHYVLVDGSASMRGVREVFARGLALALSKRLAMLGEEVVLRFFDSRLYEGVTVGANSHGEVPYVLQFRAERGRNYAAVIRQLNAELAAPRRRRGQSLVYLLTHGECQFPPEEVQALASRVPIYGVYILPSGPLELPYLDSLHRVHIIDEEAVAHGRRAGKALQIIDAVGEDLETRKREAAQEAAR